MPEVELTDSDRLASTESKELVKIPVDQRAALELLLTGKSITETARLTGVGRTTLYRWMKHDPVFQATYKQWHDQLQESCQSRLLALTDKATDAVEKALEAGDVRSALQLLKGMGMIRQRVIGPTEPEEAKKRMEIEKTRKRQRLELDEMIVGGAEG